jgi:glyoxylase-like metal-dependent hydrolase (beta-lactamase superfamily II)
MEIAPGIRRLGNGLINVYLLEDSGAVTIIDTGAPGYYGHELPAELAAMGRSLADVKAVVLTHAHSDHLGFAERIRRERSVPVSIHEADAALARGEVKPQRDPNAPGLGSIRLSILSFLIYAGRKGAMRVPMVHEVGTFGDGATLDVPGSPRAILAPGHTAGSVALLVQPRDVIFVGDVLATRNVMSGATGPRLAPFGADLGQAYDSLARFDGVEARLVLPGHGQPWTDGLAGAIAAVRSLGRPRGAAAATAVPPASDRAR